MTAPCGVIYLSLGVITTPIPDGRRNTVLASIAGHFWNRVATVEELEDELLAANAWLCCPPLPTEEVLAIAASIPRYPKGVSRGNESKDDPLSWDELEAAVVHDPCMGYFKQGRSGPRRRFPQVTDRAEIRHIRERLNLIWMETQQRLGYQGVYDRAARCGHLPAQQCRDCQTTFSEGTNHRYNCKARLHPLCLGTQSRKPLWAAQQKLEAEESLWISIVQLGSYDIGVDPFYWAPQIRDISKQVHSWVRRLTDRKDCPETISTSFIGTRFDLHNGFLSIDLVVLSPARQDDTNYLTNYFTEATERAVKIETLDVTSADSAVAVFGNLLSSPIVYDDT